MVHELTKLLLTQLRHLLQTKPNFELSHRHYTTRSTLYSSVATPQLPTLTISVITETDIDFDLWLGVVGVKRFFKQIKFENLFETSLVFEES